MAAHRNPRATFRDSPADDVTSGTCALGEVSLRPLCTFPVLHNFIRGSKTLRKRYIKMVRAWYMDDSSEDQRLPHMTDPPQILDIDQLQEKTGCLYFKLDPENYEDQLEKIKSKRGYTYQDICDIRRETLPNYDEKLKSFFREHLHSDEEIRYCADGSGYFDARDVDDRWIRIELTRGDLLIMPAGIYHRFTLDTNNYIKALRFFVGEPVWTPINRPADEHIARKSYLEKMAVQA